MKNENPSDIENNQGRQSSKVSVNFKKNENQSSRAKGVKADQEYGGPKGLEPTRYGDWERKGRCVDF